MKHVTYLIIALAASATVACATMPQSADAQQTDSAASAPVPAATVTAANASAPAGNAALGKALFLRCAACHSLSASEPQKIGPHLGGVVGREAAAVETFTYSAGMAASGLTWDRSTLDAFLTRPAALVPATSMAFAGIDSAAQRSAVIDYLESLN